MFRNQCQQKIAGFNNNYLIHYSIQSIRHIDFNFFLVLIVFPPAIKKKNERKKSFIIEKKMKRTFFCENLSIFNNIDFNFLSFLSLSNIYDLFFKCWKIYSDNILRNEEINIYLKKKLLRAKKFFMLFFLHFFCYLF